jgi:molecular chaperone DnaK
MVHSVKKSLAEHGDKLDAGEKRRSKPRSRTSKKPSRATTRPPSRKRPTALMTASQKLGEKMYADMQAAQAAGRRPVGAGRQMPAVGQARRRQRGRRRVKEVKKD